MKTCKAFLALYIFLLCSSFSFAQSNYRHAKIITSGGDTLVGLVNDKQWLKNPEFISFKEKKESRPLEYYPAQVKAVIIDSGDYYLSAVVHVDRYYSTNNDITQVYSMDSTGTDKLFFRVLVKSRLSLYLFRDENSKDHYYMKYDTGAYHELICKKVPVQFHEQNVFTNGYGMTKIYVYEDDRYKNQLKNAMRDCPYIFATVDSVPYEEKSLLKLFTDYNQCLRGNVIEYKGTIKTLHARWQVFAGLDMAMLSFRGNDNWAFLQNANFPTSYRPTIGIRGLFPLSRNREKYSMLLEAAWRNYDTKADYKGDYYYYGGPPDEYIAHFQMTYIKMNLALQYKYITSGAEPYFNLGLCAAYLINDENTLDVNPYNPNNAPPPSELSHIAFSDPSSYDFGIFGSLGIHYNRFAGELRYEHSSGFSSDTYLGSSVKSFYLLFAYQLSNSK